jgi:hypothetical protein
MLQVLCSTNSLRRVTCGVVYGSLSFCWVAHAVRASAQTAPSHRGGAILGGGSCALLTCVLTNCSAK